MRPLVETASSAVRLPFYIGSRVAAPSIHSNTVSVLFPQERLDEFSKQKAGKGEYSVNSLHKNYVWYTKFFF